MNRSTLAATLLMLAAMGGCSGESRPAATPTKTITATVTTTVTASPSPSATPTTPEASESTPPEESDECGEPSMESDADWETEDVPFPKQDVVKTRWSNADLSGSFVNNSEHTAVLDQVFWHVSKPRGSHPRPRFPAWFMSSDLSDVEVDPGETFDVPNQPYGLSEWMEQFPLYTEQEPRTSVSFDWQYKDQDAQDKCVNEPARTVAIGEKPRVSTSEPWIVRISWTKRGLQATARFCAGSDENEVFDGTKFYAENSEGKTAPVANGSPIKVPVAAGSCRDIALTFPGFTARDGSIAYPHWDSDVPLRWLFTKTPKDS